MKVHPTELHPFPTVDDDMEPEQEIAWSLNPETPKVEALPASKGFAYWVAYAEYRKEHKWDTVFLITGEEGSGKSTLGRDLCYAFQKDWDAENLCYDVKDIIGAYERIQETKARGVPILYDEGVRGLMAGETMDREQRALVRALMLVREIGAILIICSPDIWRLAYAVRGRRATVWIHITERGRALVHERDYRLHYKQNDRPLRFTVSPRAPYLTFRAFAPDDPREIAYEGVKQKRLHEFLAETKAGLPRSAEQKETRKRLQNAERQRRFRERQKRAVSLTSDTVKGTGGLA